MLNEDKNVDIDKSNEFFVKMKCLEYLSSFLTLANIWNCMILYEIDYHNDDGKYDKYVDQQLNLSTFFSLALTFLVNFRFVIELKWKKSKNFVTRKANLWSAGMVKWMVIETIVSFISPHSIFKGITITEDNTDYNTKIVYPLNHILCSFIFFKLYAVIRTIFLTNIYSKPRSQRVCSMMGCYASVTFSLRGQFKETPNLALGLTTLISAFVCAQMLRIYERPLSEVSGQRFDKFPSSLWCIIVTMSTVGYGDMFPKTIFGRLLGSILCIWGVVLESMMVVTLSEGLEFTSPQKNSYVLLQRLMYRDELQMRAVKALKSMYRYKKKNKAKNLLYSTKKINLKERTVKLEKSFKRQMFQFKVKKGEMRKFNIATEVTYLSKKVYDIIEIYADIKEHNKVFNSIQDECIQKLHQYFSDRASKLIPLLTDCIL